MKTQLMSLERKKLHDLFRQKHWFERDINLDVGDSTEFRDGWWNEPLSSLESITEPAALTRVKEIKNAQIPVTRYILRTEAPGVLPQPAGTPKPQLPTLPWKTVGVVAGVLTPVIMGVLAVVGMSLLLSPMLLVDPMLIAELPSGEMVVIYSWPH